MPTAPPDPYVKSDGKFVSPPVSNQRLILTRGQSVVSVTFDSDLSTQSAAAKMMTAKGLPGTFFVNSGTVGMPGHLSLTELESMVASGHEIGGHTVTHADLSRIISDERRREICDDRKTLIGWGFAVRSFAFPFGTSSSEDSETARACGYNSARGLGDLHSAHPTHPCDDPCDSTELVPPPNPMRTRAPDQVERNWTPTDLEQLVTDAAGKGGWLQLTFHALCSDDCSNDATSQNGFEEFVSWLATQRDNGLVLVRTVGDVIGGPVQPAVSGPVASPAPPGINGLINPGLEEQAGAVPVCWTYGGFGDNSPEFSLVATAHSGATAGRLVMRNYVSGDAKLLQTTDLGACAPAVSAGRRYTIQAWYTSSVPTSFSIQYRLARGVWLFGVASPSFAPSAQFRCARWTLPPIPDGVSAISFGLSLSQNGELVTDDYSLTGDTESPPS